MPITFSYKDPNEILQIKMTLIIPWHFLLSDDDQTVPGSCKQPGKISLSSVIQNTVVWWYPKDNVTCCLNAIHVIDVCIDPTIIAEWLALAKV